LPVNADRAPATERRQHGYCHPASFRSRWHGDAKRQLDHSSGICSAVIHGNVSCRAGDCSCRLYECRAVSICTYPPPDSDTADFATCRTEHRKRPVYDDNVTKMPRSQTEMILLTRRAYTAFRQHTAQKQTPCSWEWKMSDGKRPGGCAFPGCTVETCTNLTGEFRTTVEHTGVTTGNWSLRPPDDQLSSFKQHKRN